ncbi:LysM peptidoglycan-binding domain-containing protein [uncultured Alteromonas sp.]|jgi:membrane-bound lytic murein transglycosylase D|uniref:lytic transglycosylase n=1 Tax=uncultured Alteromonas sp. TaxID=179113 RepID=UPI0025EB42A1|nr:LysM peptidoglycan-binding domain-containing protein [uncultured Alteromonas sp.]
MKLKLSALHLIVVASLSGCQLTEQTEQAETELQDNRSTCEIAHTNINDQADCELANEGVIEVMHPTEEVEVEISPVEEAVEPVVIENLWLRASNQFAFEVPANKRVAVQRDWYLKHPAYMERVSKRARPFLYYIIQQIEAREMPLELVLLPIVESAFDPFAYSHGRAAGMWQFIPGTAKRFGIEQTWWYDGRRDVIASTDAALDYLTYLNKMFDGNWLHALAAYNSGEGRVGKAIKRNQKAGKPTDFWSLDLPRETRAYVPKLLALADILKHQDNYEFSWPEIDNAPVIATVDTGSQLDLAFAAELAGMELKSLHALNPGYNRWATDPDGPHRLVLPLDKAEGFTAQLAQVDRKERLNWVRHEVKSGDSLLKLAKEYHTTVDVIKSINDIQNNMIRIGDHLMVPVALKKLDAYTLSQDQRLASTQNQKRGSYQLTHKVAAGDTLWDIGRKYKISTRSLAKWNGMAPTDPLMPGKTLVIWVDEASDEQKRDAIMRTLTYTVKRGDSLARIAQKFNLRTSDITKWNNLNPKKYLQPGQKLTLHVDVTRLRNLG